MSTKNIFVTHRQDPTWTAVDGYTLSHLHPGSHQHHKLLNDVLINIRDQGLPDISTYPVLAKFLALQCRIGKVEHALEIGTLGGYTAIWIATQNPGIRVIAIEIDPWHAEVARQNIEMAGVSNRVTVIVGAGLDVIPKLLEEVDAGKRPKFGLVYIDADKMNNWAYLHAAIPMVLSGGCIFVDNIVRKGNIVSEEHQGEEGVIGARKVIERAGTEERVDAVVLQTVGEKSYDGVLMAVVK
ncbi:hypothetical protein MMC11_006017 [Xylographa trunciseda]|nr:hypothetical protein [Xylographa trunciseda]